MVAPIRRIDRMTKQAVTPSVKDSLDARALLCRADLQTLGITAGKQTLRRWEALGTFPKRVTLSRSTVAWPAGAVRQWLASHGAAVAGA